MADVIPITDKRRSQIQELVRKRQLLSHTPSDSLPPRLRPRAGKRSLDLQEIFRQVARGKDEMNRRWNDWCDAYALTLSDRDAFTAKVGGSAALDCYNSIGALALRGGASNVLEAIMPAEREWLRFEAGGRIPREARDRWNRQLEPWTEIFFEHLHASNHAQESLEMAYDLFVGTGPMVLNRGTYESPLEFTAVPLTQVIPIKGPSGNIETVHRAYPCAVGHIIRRYKLREADIPSEWSQLMRKDRETPVEVIESTVFQPDTEDYVIALIDPKGKRVVWYEVSVTSPWIMPEWQRSTGNLYARGPLMDVLPDLRSCNDMTLQTLIAAQLRTRPPLEVSAYDPRNPFTIRLKPGALNMTGAAPGQRSIFPMDLGSSPEYGQVQISRLEERIKAGLLDMDFLPSATGAIPFSATEVMVRKQEAIRRAGANYARLQGSYLFQLARRAGHILSDFDLFPAVKIDNRMVKLKYVGPLQQTQEAAEVDNVFAWNAKVRAAVPEEVYAGTVALEELAEYTAKRSGITSKLYRSQEQRTALQQTIAQGLVTQAQQQQAMQAQQAQAQQQVA